MNGLVPLLADSLLQGSADVLTGLVILLFAWLGSRYGLYLATVWGLQALVSVMAAFALGDVVDGWIVHYGGASDFIAFWHQTLAFVTALLVVAIAIRVAIGGAIEEGATNYPALVDLAGGGIVGAIAGMIVAGIIQVVLAMAPLPERFAFDSTKTAWDLGSGIIDLVGHCAGGMEKEDREILMNGEPGFRPDKVDPVAAVPAAPVDPTSPPVEKIELPQWSEVFADTNWNQMWDKGEKYLDADGNGAFTWILRSNDRNTNKTRDIGLRERYELGPWVTVGTLTKQQIQNLQRQTRKTKIGEIEGLPWPPPGGFFPGMGPDDTQEAVAQPGAASVQPVPGVPGQPVPGQVPGQNPAQPLPGQPVPNQPQPTQPTQPGQPVQTLPGTAQPSPTQPGQPLQPGRPAQGNQPGVPKQPGQPSQPGTPTTVPPATEPPAPPAPDPTPAPPTPAPSTPGRANETPTPAPAPVGPPSPFKPKK